MKNREKQEARPNDEWSNDDYYNELPGEQCMVSQVIQWKLFGIFQP